MSEESFDPKDKQLQGKQEVNDYLKESGVLPDRGVFFDSGSRNQVRNRQHILLAQKGDAKEQYYLALEYDSGQGVPQDRQLANQWLKKSAEKGYAPAQYRLGLVYLEKNDLKEAVKYFELAARNGNPFAQYKLAEMYKEGEGVAKDDLSAMKWCQAAANQGYIPAQILLGDMYCDQNMVHYKGDGHVSYYDKALVWYTAAARQGDPVAQFNVGWMLERHMGNTTLHIERQEDWYAKAANQGYAPAQYRLGLIFYNGIEPGQYFYEHRGVTPDHALAAKWIKQAAAQGYKKAMVFIEQHNDEPEFSAK